ncbi:hypothetical protein [Anabaena sp. YBS01]|uniref:hypothetical protein n=1 Tax=Anabaena sp. YBS01 TaxID=2490939 RepID=UPI001D170C17|nr:hypothetical protein [Anabaena sp. YBS01]
MTTEPEASTRQETPDTPPSIPSPIVEEVKATSSPAPQSSIPSPSEDDFAQIWQQVLSNIQQIPRRALLGQMCYLIDFAGTVARIGVKAAWYDKVKSDLPMITSAFQQTFNREVQVTLERGNPSNATTVRKVAPANGNGNSNGNGHNGTSSVQQPPSPTYSNQKPTTPLPQPTATAPTPKTTPIAPSTGGAKTPPPKENQAPLLEWETDEVAIAAQRLAKFFDGQIIRFTDDGEALSEMGTSEWTDESDLDDE